MTTHFPAFTTLLISKYYFFAIRAVYAVIAHRLFPKTKTMLNPTRAIMIPKILIAEATFKIAFAISILVHRDSLHTFSKMDRSLTLPVVAAFCAAR